jgi:hypothetical protein
MNGTDQASGRETRLLVLVIVVALAVLLVLSRLRFPETKLAAVAPGPSPLDRLAARTTYDDLGNTIASLVDRVSPTLVTLRLEADSAPRRTTRGSTGRGAASAEVESQPALGVRIRPDVAAVYVPPGFHVAAEFTVAAADETRGVALITVAPPNPPVTLPAANDIFAGFEYVAAVEPALGGPTAKPVFIGRADPAALATWAPSPLLIGGGSSGLAAGAILYDLDGRLVGLTMPRGRDVVVVPAAALEAIVRELIASPSGTLPR